MNHGNKLSINRNEKKRGFKAETEHHVFPHNPSIFRSKENMLQVKLPEIGEHKVIKPDSMKLTFNFAITGEDNDSWPVNNITLNLIRRITVKWDDQTLLETEGYDLYKTYKDLWLTTAQRDNMIRRGIQSVNLRKLRSGATSGVANEVDSQLAKIYENVYEIPLDFTFLSEQHPFYEYIHRNKITIDLYFNEPKLVINSTDKSAITDYQLTNIKLEYDTTTEPNLCNSIKQLSKANAYPYDYIIHKLQFIDKEDTSFSFTCNDRIQSLKGICMLFEIPSTDATRDAEYFYNPDITKVKITYDSVDKLFNQGFKPHLYFPEACKLFMNEAQKTNGISHINSTNFYTKYFSLCIDTRSTEDNTLHGSGLKLESTMTIDVSKNSTGKGKIFVHVYLLCDARYIMEDGRVTRVEYKF